MFLTWNVISSDSAKEEKRIWVCTSKVPWFLCGGGKDPDKSLIFWVWRISNESLGGWQRSYHGRAKWPTDKSHRDSHLGLGLNVTSKQTSASERARLGDQSTGEDARPWQGSEAGLGVCGPWFQPPVQKGCLENGWIRGSPRRAEEPQLCIHQIPSPPSAGSPHLKHRSKALEEQRMRGLHIHPEHTELTEETFHWIGSSWVHHVNLNIMWPRPGRMEW